MHSVYHEVDQRSGKFVGSRRHLVKLSRGDIILDVGCGEGTISARAKVYDMAHIYETSSMDKTMECWYSQ